jgi:flagellar protein FliS
MTSDLARNAYQQVEVNSSSGLQLVVMLYDGAIRFLGDAKACIENGDLSGKALAIDRTLAIIGELQSTLKLEEGGELAQSLDKLYTYMTERVIEASLKLNIKPVDEVVKLLSILNSAWTEIARKPEPVVMPQPIAFPPNMDWNLNRERRQPLEIFG